MWKWTLGLRKQNPRGFCRKYFIPWEAGCGKHNKFNGFHDIYSFYEVMVSGFILKALGIILGGFLRPQGDFSDL